jgi:hypothetical protein
MGFLDHSTNNIIVDAVLTDVGRRALAKNDGSFNIFQFALGDDEVDYSVIQQFGRTVGREKIEKNTPVMEALTAGSMGLKYKLISASDEFLTHMPSLTLTLSGGTGSTISFVRGTTTQQTLDVTISSKTGVGIPDDLIDGELRVEVNDLFLRISGEAPDIVFTDNIAVYNIPAAFGETADSIKSSIPIVLKSPNDTTFNTFSAAGGTYIRTFIKVVGVNSGLTSTIEVQISK